MAFAQCSPNANQNRPRRNPSTRRRCPRVSAAAAVGPEERVEHDADEAIDHLRSFELVGDLISTGVVHVEGSVRGKLALSTITIGSKGVVEGTIQCETLHVKGRFSGTAHCRELTLSADAPVDGQVYYSTIAVQRGAKISGELVKK